MFLKFLYYGLLVQRYQTVPYIFVDSLLFFELITQIMHFYLSNLHNWDMLNIVYPIHEYHEFDLKV